MDLTDFGARLRDAAEAGVERHVELIRYGESGFDECEAVERTVFRQWFGVDDDAMRDEYGPYDRNSVFAAVCRPAEGRIVGVFRVVHNSEASIPTINDMRDFAEWRMSDDAFRAATGIDRSDPDLLDASTVAILDDARSDAVTSLLLFGHIGLYFLAAGTSCLVTLIDTAVLELAQAAGVPWKVIADLPAVEHLGSPSTVPAYVARPEVLEEVSRGRSPFARAVRAAESFGSMSQGPMVIDLRDDALSHVGGPLES